MPSKVRREEHLREGIEDADKFNTVLVSQITQLAEETITKGTLSVPWCDESCKQAVKDRNRVFRHLKKHHSLDTLNQYKKTDRMK